MVDRLGEGGWMRIKERDDDGIKFVLGIDEEADDCIIEAVKEFLEAVWMKRR